MMKKLIYALMLVCVLVLGVACSNGAKDKYMAQKEFVDSLQKANTQQINGAILTGSAPEVLNVKLKCYDTEVAALDSLTKLAKEAYGDNSAEYKEAYDLKIKTKELSEKATEESLNSIKNFMR